MRKILLMLLICTMITGTVMAVEMTVESKVKQVTVYTDRALVEREAIVSLEPGENRLVFDFLPESVDSGSLQVKGAKGALLQDIEFKIRYYSSIPDKKINILEEQLREIDDRIEDKSDAVRRAREEKAFMEKIIASVTTTPDENPVELDPEKWIKMVDFYSTKTGELDVKIRQIERENRILLSEREAVALEYNDLVGGRSKRKNQAIIILQADSKMETRVVLSYLVHGPSWYPDYDMRVDSQRKKINLFYNARVRQNTGEDWSGINLVLSTASPHIFGKQPDLIPWNIRIFDKTTGGLMQQEEAPGEGMYQMYNMHVAEDRLFESGISGDMDSLTATTSASVSTGATAVRFHVAGAYSINSDNNFHKVPVSDHEFPAAFRYSAVPKLTQYAYLKARVTNNTELPLLRGSTKVFLDGDFVANSTIDNIAPGEEFWTFLGIDERIEISYKMVSRKEIKGNIFETKDGERYHYKMTIKNKKNTTDEIVVWDQLPVTTDKSIKISLVSPKYSKDSDELKKNDQDFLEWFMKLGPGEEKEIHFEFSVEYPKGKSVQGL